MTLSGPTPNFSRTSAAPIGRFLIGSSIVHPVADELHHVLVGRDDRHLGARLDGLAGIGRDQIVGLEILQLDPADVERVGRVAHQLELRDEVVGRLAAGAPCTGRRCGCGTCCPEASNTTAMWSASVSLQQLLQHVAKAEHGLGRRPVRRGSAAAAR